MGEVMAVHGTNIFWLTGASAQAKGFDRNTGDLLAVKELL